MNIVLNIAHLEKKSIVNGPGERFVIWVQGCPLKCKGCINEDLWELKKNKLMNVNKIIKEIKSTKGIEGVTYTGGEPMLQAKGLFYLSKKLKELGLSIVCYTGYTMEELKEKKDKWIDNLLKLVDILITGRYVESLRGNFLWRGSKNQKILFLSNRYIQYKDFLEKEEAEAEIILKKEEIVITGILNRNFLLKLEEELKKVKEPEKI